MLLNLQRSFEKTEHIRKRGRELPIFFKKTTSLTSVASSKFSYFLQMWANLGLLRKSQNVFGLRCVCISSKN